MRGQVEVVVAANDKFPLVQVSTLIVGTELEVPVATITQPTNLPFQVTSAGETTLQIVDQGSSCSLGLRFREYPNGNVVVLKVLPPGWHHVVTPFPPGQSPTGWIYIDTPIRSYGQMSISMREFGFF